MDYSKNTVKDLKRHLLEICPEELKIKIKSITRFKDFDEIPDELFNEARSLLMKEKGY